MPSLIACSHSRDDPASRFRVLQYLPHLEAAGWRVAHRPNRPSRYWKPPLRPLKVFAGAARHLSRRRDIRDAAAYDAVLLNRDLLKGDIAWEKRLFARNRNVVFDFDDAIFLGQKRQDHIGWICAEARWVTAGNDYLADFARRFTDRVTVLPTVVETDRYLLRSALEQDMAGPVETRRVRVGWLGSDLSIRETLFVHWEMIARLQQKLDFDLVICSWPRPKPPSNVVRWRFVPWSPSTEEEIAREIDIGIMPLVDNEYQRGKCGLKLLQYMAAGLPVIASTIGVNGSIVEHGTSGYLAGDEAAWLDALAALIGSADLRRRFGEAGRRRCEADFALKTWLPTLLGILDAAARPQPALEAALQ
jgi:glycosyltransferase involved in cell wall biosynthesis